MSQQHHRRADTGFRRDLLITAQVALLGEISPAVRGITLGWDSEEIRLRAVMDGDPSEDDKESMEAVGTELIASFPDLEIEVEVLRVDTPEPLEPYNLEAWVYRRRER